MNDGTWQPEAAEGGESSRAVEAQESDRHRDHSYRPVPHQAGDSLSELPPTLEAEFLEAIRLLERRDGKATTKALATHLHLSPSQIWRYLSQLEAHGQVQRIGIRGGWKRSE